MNFTRLNSFFNLSVRVGRLFGIPIILHITLLFFILPAFYRGSWDFLHLLEYSALIVLSILVHELGHALTAKHFRQSDLSIVLHGFGGFAMSRGRRTPTQELLIVLAGPGATFTLGAICLLVGNWGIHRDALGDEAFNQFWLLHELGRLNIMMGFLNLIPSLPWDGGLALQAILSHRMDPFKAMRLTAHIGLVVITPLLIYSVLNPQGYFFLFCIVGFFTCLITLLNSGGVRFGEFAADRRHRKEMEAVRKREQERQEAYLGEVHSRQREREEQERLRKLFEASGIDD